MRVRKKRNPKDKPLPNLTAEEYGYLGMCKSHPELVHKKSGKLRADDRAELERLATKAIGVQSGRSPDDIKQERGYLEFLSPELIENFSPEELPPEQLGAWLDDAEYYYAS